MHQLSTLAIAVLHVLWPVLKQLHSTLHFVRLKQNRSASVTRRLHCLFNIWPFTTSKKLPESIQSCQRNSKILPNTSKWEPFLIRPNYATKCWIFAKTGHIDAAILRRNFCLCGNISRINIGWPSQVPVLRKTNCFKQSDDCKVILQR